jgi:hypothetical protein
VYIYGNISDNSCRKYQNAHFVIHFLESCPLLDNVEKYGTSRQATVDSIIRRMRFACCFTKAIDTHSEYVICIAFLWQQWLYERASMLNLYVHFLSWYFSSSFVNFVRYRIGLYLIHIHYN